MSSVFVPSTLADLTYPQVLDALASLHIVCSRRRPNLKSTQATSICYILLIVVAESKRRAAAGESPQAL